MCNLAVAQEAEPLLHVPSPDWRDQVIYFVLTDRFADGDPSNNDQGAGVYNPALGSHYSGGDLAGIRRQLDYIQGLGATSVWLTPPVANQWWYERGQYGGYHGYWATDFSQVDPHYGDLASYQGLSDALHRRGMYLIQDIVVNHTGNFFGYDGDYNPDNTAEHFTLFPANHPGDRRPTQAPFDQLDRLDPAQAAADIYHWTPPIQDYSDPVQQFSYQLTNLADLNTGHPQVRQVLKQSYGDWIRQVGVDAFRVDTAKYVEHEFWRDFFWAEDGIMAAAKQTGRDHFLAFGEVFEDSPPMTDRGERIATAFLGSESAPQLNSVIGFPLYFELGRVLAQGQPPAQLAYRLRQHMALYPDPYVIPNFIDNHDTPRFLASGSEAGLQQALGLIFTIPGIPVIYQGDEQGLRHSRQAMFAGGYLSDRDQFDTQAPLYRWTQQLAQLRQSESALRRGSLTVLAAEQQAPGLLAFERIHLGRRLVVLLNTSDRTQLVSGVELGRGQLTPLLLEPGAEAQPTTVNQSLTLALPPRAFRVYAWQEAEQSNETPAPVALSLDTPLAGQLLTEPTVIAGQFARPDLALYLVEDGDLDRAKALEVAANGRWQATLPVADLGTSERSLSLYVPALNQATAPIAYQTRRTEPAQSAQVSSPTGYRSGYQPPSHEASGSQHDLRGARLRSGGEVLELTLTMAEISDGWLPSNGFDNVSFQIFFDLSAVELAQPTLAAATALPGQSASMPDGRRWQLGHSLFGWGNGLFLAEGATSERGGTAVTPVPQVRVDKDKGTITLSYRGRSLGIEDWRGVGVYVTTWDRTGEGALRPLESEAGPWSFGGQVNGPKVMDALWVELTP
ncbi:alpha-amylase family glycosyl hydrolase [Ferrimonas marina]|uniref:alpha-amylase family glycosyl hydrolase n=1 Tax=Ferrimonas marina TaxID=299255 RepID=UPI0008312029|nr:alpha-amylase family glycosyl hydrolase [Ferrimonas marina]